MNGSPSPTFAASPNGFPPRNLSWSAISAWIPTGAGKVDFLYRSVEHVERVIDDADAGRIESHYYQQPTYGFHSVIYLAEMHICLPLHDPRGHLARLKERVAIYPPELKRTIVGEHLWGVEFTLMFARQHAAAGDAYNTIGCLTRILNHMTQTLYALNETYFLSDKRVGCDLARFLLLPADYLTTMNEVLARSGRTVGDLSERVVLLEKLFRDVVQLAGPLYRPKYVLPSG